MLGTVISSVKWQPVLILLALFTSPDLAALTEFGTYKWGISPKESKKNTLCHFYLEGSSKTLSGKNEQHLNGVCPLEAISAKAFTKFFFEEDRLTRVQLVVPLNPKSLEKFSQAARTTYKEALEGHPRGDKPLSSTKKTLKEINDLKVPRPSPAELIELLERAWGKASQSNIEHLNTITKASSHQMVGLFWSQDQKNTDKTVAITMTDEGVLSLIVQFFSTKKS
jgi:hypothetical protein